MRALTAEQKALMASIEWPLPPPTEEELAALEAAKAYADKLRAEQQAAWEAKLREMAEEVRPLKEALRAAGIKLTVESYEGIWGSYQLPGGPVVKFDQDDLDTEEDND